jgi:hypothetical protein
MNSDYEKQLEIRIGSALQELPELEAPASIVPQVMATLQRRSGLVWYRRSWQSWPRMLRAVSLVTLMALFVGLWFAGREFFHTDMMIAAGQRAGEWFAGLSSITNTLGVLLNSACLVVRKLGAGLIIACLFAFGLTYLMCVGLGTMYMRLTFAKH